MDGIAVQQLRYLYRLPIASPSIRRNDQQRGRPLNRRRTRYFSTATSSLANGRACSGTAYRPSRPSIATLDLQPGDAVFSWLLTAVANGDDPVAVRRRLADHP